VAALFVCRAEQGPRAFASPAWPIQ
jgi:hypothetical protein